MGFELENNHLCFIQHQWLILPKATVRTGHSSQHRDTPFLSPKTHLDCGRKLTEICDAALFSDQISQTTEQDVSRTTDTYTVLVNSECILCISVQKGMWTS